MKWIIVAFGVVVLLACLVVTAFSLAGVAWNRGSMRIREEMSSGAVAPSPVAAEPLPPPVARYLARSVPPDAGAVVVARIEQSGEFQTGEGPDGWRPFTAVQTVRAYPPAFLWDARISMGPFMAVRVRDLYLDGEGGMRAKMGGLIPVMDAPPSPELTEAALLRYLAEAPWTPSRLRPGNGLTWEAVDDSSAVATLTDRGRSVSVTMTFSEEGDVARVFVPDRGREVDGAFVPTPWVGRFWDHEVVAEGFRVPVRGEVAWIVDGDTVPYWRGRLLTVEYSVSP